ncbi:MAG: DUF2306 domain-containing protein [Hyphomonadaceae bacterium]
MLSRLQAGFATIPRSVAWAATFLILAVGIAPFAPYIAAAAGEARLHAPNWALLAAQPPALKIHIAAALMALGVGLFLMLRPKGRGLHKPVGWVWVAAMAVTAVSSLFITTFSDSYSIIHLFAGWTIIALPMAIAAIRRRNVRAHGRGMTGLFIGGLLIAGALTFLPGRLMWTLFLG